VSLERPQIALDSGILGEIVQAVEPHTEADPVGLLVDLLTAFGSAVGPGPHAIAGASKHPSRLFAVLVGDSAKARKGTGRAVAQSFMEYADPEWSEKRRTSGLSTGEGLIAAASSDQDCRLFVHEPEFARVLKVSGRDGNTLSPILRQAWDSGDLSVMTRGEPLRARGVHVSVVAHITREELRERLTSTEAVNGFANRFLWVLVKRSKLLPNGGDMAEVLHRNLARRLGSVIADARKRGCICRTPDAEAYWKELYHQNADDEPGGLLGAAVARADAQLLRLSVMFALADGAREVARSHLEAAYDLWRYCRESAEQLFGPLSGVPQLDRLREALQGAGADGLSKTDIQRLFGRHLSADRLRYLTDELVERGDADWTTEETGGRPVSYLRIRHEICETSELSTPLVVSSPYFAPATAGRR